MADIIETIPSYTKSYDWKSGPDNLCPAESTISSKLTQPVILRLNEIDKKKFPPISIYSVFKKTVSLRPDYDALAYKKDADSPWAKFSFGEYWKMCHKAAKSFMKVF